jgi:transposase-like protein
LKFVLGHDKDQSMKRRRFSEEQIIGILKEHETGVSVADLCHKHGVSDASIYKWRAIEHAAEAAVRRRHAGQRGLKGPRGKEMVTPAAKRKAVAISEAPSGWANGGRVKPSAAAAWSWDTKRPGPTKPALASNRPGTSSFRLSTPACAAQGGGYLVNHKKLFRLYREERLAVRRRGGRKRAIGARAPMTVLMVPNDRWSLDFVSDQLTDGRASVSSP